MLLWRHEELDWIISYAAEAFVNAIQHEEKANTAPRKITSS